MALTGIYNHAMIVDMPDAEPRQAEVRTGKLSRLEAYGQDAGRALRYQWGSPTSGAKVAAGPNSGIR